MSTKSKVLLFNMLIKYADSSSSLANIFLAFTIFPLFKETVVVMIGLKDYESANFELNDYFYYNIACIIFSLLLGLSAVMVNRCIEES